MISKEDCILLLTDLQESGVEVKDQLLKTIRSKDINPETVQFINKNRQMDLSKFYEKLRKSYNNKKSNLYINLVKDLDEDSTTQVLTTLASLNLQLLLFSKEVSDYQMFIRAARMEEINKCLLNYSRTYDIIPCIKLLRILKADLKCLEQSLK